MRTALITGAMGQDGRLLTKHLLAIGYRVIGQIRQERLPPPVDGSLADMHFVSTDLSDASAVRALLDKWQPDEIYHLAAFHHASEKSSISSAIASKEAMLVNNFLTTKTLAFSLVELRADCHLVFAASSQMYTAGDKCQEITETTLRKPSTFYGLTKSWSFELLASLRENEGLRASSAILFNHESPLRGAQFVSRKISRAAVATKLGTNARLTLNNIGARVDWCSARDVVRALQLMASTPYARDYVVASGVLHSVKYFAATAFEYLGLDWSEHTICQEDCETPALLGQSRELCEILGWQRSITFEEMVAEMVDHDLANARMLLAP